MDESTVQTIIDRLAEMASKKEVISPQMWMDASQKITVLLQVEEDKLAEMEFALDKLRRAYIEDGQKVNAAEVFVRSEPEYLAYRKQVGLISTANKTVMNAKRNATLASELMRYNLD